MYCSQKLGEDFAKFLWPSQNIWTLMKIKNISLKNGGTKYKGFCFKKYVNQLCSWSAHYQFLDMLFNEVRHESEITFILRWYKIGTQSESEK